MNTLRCTIWRLIMVVAVVGCLFPVQAGADTRLTDVWIGSFEDMIHKRRVVRVLTSYSRTNYFLVGGELHGLEYDLLTQYHDYLKEQFPTPLPLEVVFIAVPFDQLIPALLAGKGDVVAAGLTITDKRARQVAFTHPYRKGINEVVVRNNKVPELSSIRQLAGKKVLVARGTSYVTHLARLNRQLEQEGLQPVDVEVAPAGLTTEDVLEMVNTGTHLYTIADTHLAELWSRVFSHLAVQNNLQVHSGGQLGWAVRPQNTALLRSLDTFITSRAKQGTLLGNMLFKRYYDTTKWIRNPLSEANKIRLQQYRAYFQTYASRYQQDWIKIAAQAFQESELDQSARSAAGAIGLMQLLPSTANDPAVNIPTITNAQDNVHAGCKYMRWIQDTYFSAQDIHPQVQMDFSLAAYNAGPSRIDQLRKEAARQGYNPNIWFSNVEYLAMQEVGNETVDYVSNILKYYVAFRSLEHTLQARPAVPK